MTRTGSGDGERGVDKGGVGRRISEFSLSRHCYRRHGEIRRVDSSKVVVGVFEINCKYIDRSVVNCLTVLSEYK